MSDALTIEKLEEAMALIKALAPKVAPDNLNMIQGMTGLRIIKNQMLPADTIIVSMDLFNKIYEASEKSNEEKIL